MTWAVTVGWDPNNDIDMLEMNLLQLIFFKGWFHLTRKITNYY